MAARNVYINPQERKELERYIKFFIIKAVQVIVQSRLGERVHTECRTFSAGSDWFNVGVNDVMEVLNESKKCYSEHNFMAGDSINVEISLCNSENETMTLEVWTMKMNPQLKQQVRVSYTVYNRLGILLKSLYCITRVVNAYKLSRTQGADSYVIFYRIYGGDPDLSHIGAKERQVKVGTVATPGGSLFISSVCRTQMLLSPQTSAKNLSMDLKENYFNIEPPLPAAKPCHILGHRQLNEQVDGVEPELIDTLTIQSFATSPPAEATMFISKDSPKDKMFKLGSSSENTDSSGSGHRIRTPDKARRFGAFAPRRASQVSLDEEVPFSILLEMSQAGNSELSVPSIEDFVEHDMDSVSKSILDEPDFSQAEQRPDDFIFVDLKTPFAVPDGESELGRFYRSCQAMPELEVFNQGPTIHDTLEDLDLDKFEKNLTEFDDFFNSMSLDTGATGSPV